ncbi:unnamed protein product [Gongylonema pulchrum]|uniref:DUF4258 domain-containing protein n=1 Tax=Gongylonema pulchrum TaxID=637853 RepID=A0A183DGH7_9BILA|nr:unnamed protein product [Gongylonema pulchrum]
MEHSIYSHINCGRDYQAKVKKWADRAITDEERDAIPDRDEAVFDCNVIDHLEDSAGMLQFLVASDKVVNAAHQRVVLAVQTFYLSKITASFRHFSS